VKRIYYGWWIALAAFLNLFFAVGILYYGFPVFYPALVNELGFTRAQTTEGFLLGFVFVGLSFSLAAGALIDRIGPRQVIRWGIGFLGLSLVFMGRMSHLWQYYLLAALCIPLLFLARRPTAAWGFAVLFGLAMGADYMLIPLVTAQCFGIGGLGKLLALIIMGYSVGQWMGPVLAGRIFDATRSYDAAWGIMTVAGVLGAATIYAVSPQRRV
jgi:MFS family permease